VLTAAHCVATLADNDNDYTVGDPNLFTAHVGRRDNRDRGKQFKIDRIETRRYRELRYRADGSAYRTDDDIALLHLKRPTSAQPLWLLPNGSLVSDGSDVVLHGYGRTSQAPGSSGSLHKTRAGQNYFLPGNCGFGVDDGNSCVFPRFPESFGREGDSGASWVVDVDGRSVGVLVFSGYVSYPGTQTYTYQYGENVYNALTATWLRTTVGIPYLLPGRIVRDPRSREAWLIGGDGFRRSIPDGGTYLCLVGNGATVTDQPRRSIDLMPARLARATCATTAF